jgi:hypothetical protein
MQPMLGTLDDGDARISKEHAPHKVAADDACARAASFPAPDHGSVITGASFDADACGFMP